ncbi:hypothetical protein SO802_020994 [Lithocarpus litseifolius]|uniref:Uncharacterized protein n=1 Tax=Lithocarpus litseifolius TaxID=425828 RepID=A0AAW2CE47_9ROSI
MFLLWTHRLACKLGIHRIVFSPSGAMALSIMYSLWRDQPRRENPSDENEVVSFPNIPSSPKYPWWKLSPLYRSFVEANLDSKFIKDAFRANMGHYSHLGPIRGGSSSGKVEEILSWLDTCEDHKVVFVCFWSQALLNNNQMEKLAFGLEKSGVQFVWVVKEPTELHVDGDNNTVPPGFKDRVFGRGLVIRGWAPQGIVAGVPLLTWPSGANQFVNDSLSVDELKVAIRVGEVDLLSREQVECKQAAELRGVALEAIEGGSSVIEFDSMVSKLAALTLPVKNSTS